MLKRRVGTAAVALPVLAAAVWAGGALFALLAATAAAVGAWELCRMMRARGRLPFARIAVAAAAILAAAPLWLSLAAPGGARTFVENAPETLAAAVLTGIALSALMLARNGRGGGLAARAAVSLWIALLLGGTMFHAATLRNGADGAFWTAFALAATFATDTGAYFVGRALGSRKLAPSVSPNKTWEGAVGGLLSAAAVGAAMGALWANAAPPPGVYTAPAVSPALAAALGGVAGGALSVVGQFGDLYVSKLKRLAGFDDSGTLFPGHGGILDRMDSLMFAAAAAVYLRAALGWALGG